ncbi:hypothetical protein Trisim1_005535 [Trichoderma cf. simile WF8]
MRMLHRKLDDLLATRQESSSAILYEQTNRASMFFVEDQTLALMTTLSRVIILVGKTDVITGKDARSLHSLHDYLKSRDAIITATSCLQIHQTNANDLSQELLQPFHTNTRHSVTAMSNERDM